MQYSYIDINTAKQMLLMHQMEGASVVRRGSACTTMARVVNTVLTTQSAPPPPLYI